MASTQARDAEQPPGPQRAEALRSLIAGQVVKALGAPTAPYRVQVRPLWGRSYRVNVLIGPEVFSAGVADSFFVTVDDDGTVVASDPRIIRKY